MPDTVAQNINTCRNCGTQLSGAYCHACGQQVREGATLRGQVKQSLASLATPGGRFFETLVSLLTTPGELTRSINSGKRRQFLAPWATLAFAMLVLHMVQWAAGGPDRTLSHESAVTMALERADKALGDYADSDAYETPGSPAFLRGEEQAARSALTPEERQERALSTRFFTDQAAKAWNPATAAPAPASWRDSFIQEIARTLALLPALYPLLGWLLVPLLLPAMLGLFWRRPGFSGLDHSRFLAHAIAFSALALAFGTILLASAAPFMAVAAAVIVAIVVHGIFHLRGSYALDWPPALWRAGALLVASAAAILMLTAGVTLWRTAL